MHSSIKYIYLVGYTVLQLSKGSPMRCYPVYSMQSGHPPLLHSRSGQSDSETTLNFDLKFELDCTRCLWNNYHSVQAQITLLDFIFMIMMKRSEKERV